FGPDLDQAAAILKRGGLVGIPTETVYGLAADAFNPQALAKVFAVKERPFFDPLILHIGNATWLDRVAVHIPREAKRLADRFWPGPLTLVLPKIPAVPDLATAGLSTVGVRVPAHPLTL